MGGADGFFVFEKLLGHSFLKQIIKKTRNPLAIFQRRARGMKMTASQRAGRFIWRMALYTFVAIEYASSGGIGVHLTKVSDF